MKKLTDKTMPKNHLMKSLNKAIGRRTQYRGVLVFVLPDGGYNCLGAYCRDISEVDDVINGAAENIADSIINKENNNRNEV